MPTTSKYGNSSNRDPEGPQATQARIDFLEYDHKCPPEQIRIFMDGSGNVIKKGNKSLCGSGSEWRNGFGLLPNSQFVDPISTNGSNIQGETCAFRLNMARLIQRDIRDTTVRNNVWKEQIW